jgi:hypothetical protein
LKKSSLTNLRLSASAASGPGIVIVILDGAATLYFLINGLHNFIFTSNSKIVLAKTLIIGEIIDGKKLNNSSLIKEKKTRKFVEFTLQMKMMLTYHLLFHLNVVEKI